MYVSSWNLFILLVIHKALTKIIVDNLIVQIIISFDFYFKRTL